MSIEWNEDLATGIAGIDDQHRELYANVARLHRVMKERRLEEIPELLGFLERYVLLHFKLEEDTMLAAGYPGYQAHRDAHRAFVDEFLRHRDRLLGGSSAGKVVDLSAWLGQWLRDHVRGVDGEMARFLRAS